MRLLLVEDETRLADALSYILKKNKYAVDVAYDGEAGQDLAESGIYDLIILDRMLPKKEGISILRELRNQGISTPVLLLTARDSIEDRVYGLDAGADDYLVKPFATDELLARIRALARRQEKKLQGEKIAVPGLTLDTLHLEASTGNGAVKLTLKEAQLLELLMRNFGQVITKDQIIDRVWGFSSDAEANNVEIYIYYLRKKLDLRSLNLQIETVRGVGYCFKEAKDVS